ncbi:LPXTG cell wall anchor domain-containing protein [Streptoalloteichus hindustanus]|uniref:LPXTG-motif cell wall anchor domain-containing protein/conserved repeat domain-containing protein n=1 Tax=Streptoalloteichus hindustanus TaxID=2017 RepID=A0A1M4TQX2_STRHI|nr:LPXTG cell wall anchor domain-containing protein [Streptoalloteichus hindustanus]SHE46796.1 LPXTG-motif cell wall anchor domain-containing protein/conserved repeat domain-containing protein [Streptoalloteichus hindustanus]
MALTGFLLVGPALGFAHAQQSSENGPAPASASAPSPPPSSEAPPAEAKTEKKAEDNAPKKGTPQAPLADLAVSAKLDRDDPNKNPYHAGDTVVITVTVTNIGEATANGVRHIRWTSQPPPDDLRIEPAAWGDLAPDGPGVSLGAGDVRTVTLRTTVPEWAADRGGFAFFTGFTHNGAEADHHNNSIRLHARTKLAQGTLTGVVFHDRNGNKQVDPGEGVGQVKVRLFEMGQGGPDTQDVYGEATTGPDGSFLISAEVGCHWVDLAPGSSWQRDHASDTWYACTKRANPAHLLVPVMPVNGTSTTPTPTPAVSSSTTTAVAPVAAGAGPQIAAPLPAAKAVPQLANTGADVGGLTIGGALAVLAGSAAVVLARRRTRGETR